MTTKLVVDSDSELREVQLPPQSGTFLKAVASFLSYVFHPVFVPVYLVAFLLFIEPFLFVGFGVKQKTLILIQSILMYTFFPLVSVFLMKALKFINSIKLKERKDRIIPFIACNIWYFWIWYVWRNLPEMPREAVVFAMAVFLASSIGLLFNIYMKISMHSIALGTAVAFLIGLSFIYGTGLSLYLAIVMIIGGLVCTARLILGEHEPVEIYWGLAAGVLSVVLANIIV